MGYPMELCSPRFVDIRRPMRMEVVNGLVLDDAQLKAAPLSTNLCLNLLEVSRESIIDKSGYPDVV